MLRVWSVILLAGLVGVAGSHSSAAEGGLEAKLRMLDTTVLSPEFNPSTMLRADVRARRDVANQRDREEWSRIRIRHDWERFRKPRIAALRQSLGLPKRRSPLTVHVSRTLLGSGFRIENLVYESRPGVWVTANLYVPEPVREKMPCFVIIHSHHNARTQGELQDMGMTWARAGAMVLVPDQPGYGERRFHRAGNRQDYRFRYIHGNQLHVAGESLIGWMAWDTMRGLDLLLSRPGADKQRVIVIGSVAGGGDPAAVVAAVDPRVTCAVPFNFGGPQPETTYPLPADAESSFNYVGSAYWEPTRNLRLSGRDGFLPWAIIGSLTPRRLIYAHEFSWDRERDPVWRRLKQIWGFYGAPDRLSFTHGAGLLSGQPPEATHCNNVGAYHRRLIHTSLERWFQIPVPEELTGRRDVEELRAITPELTAKLGIRSSHDALRELGATRAEKFTRELKGLGAAERRKRLRENWSRLLGEVEPVPQPRVDAGTPEMVESIRVQRVTLRAAGVLRVPLLLLTPARGTGAPPVVVAFCQEGKQRFLRERSDDVAALLERGIAVCLPDVRGTGETAPPGGRGYQSEATSLSAGELMFGRTLLGGRLRDLRTVVQYLRSRPDLQQRFALWGESFAAVNPAGFRDPLIGEEPAALQCEPLGGMLALFGALYEPEVKAVLSRGSFTSYGSLLRDPYCYVPHDAMIPGALTAGDLSDVAAALAPRPLRLEALVDGKNVRASRSEVAQAFKLAGDAYRNSGLELHEEGSADTAGWLARSLAVR